MKQVQIWNAKMLGLVGRGSNDRRVLEALDRSLGIIEFDPTGTILTANLNFCNVVGYRLDEIQGKHHSIFVDPAYVSSSAYKDFWRQRGAGEFDAREYQRVAKGGRSIWLQASYNPVKASNGTVLKVVKIATDITDEKLQTMEFEAKINAISRVQAMIEFTPLGEIIVANQNFLSTMGYTLAEIEGKHHRMFVDPSYGQSAEYHGFWKKLNAGEFISDEFVRIGKSGKQVWLRASYNPVFGLDNKVVKVIKFATDISDWGHALKEIGIGLSHLAQNNLVYRLDTPFNPTFEKLRADFNFSLERLQSSMVKIADSVDAIQAGADEISTAADDLSRRTEQQAANLEETAGALNQITATVKTSANGATHARDVVITANEDAKKSSVVVIKTVGAMDGIAKSAQQISQIIGVIDEIAFQTNLLALNAGVEAARAGDAGRGFAVVASEVRALAQRSAEAAKEIKSLISASTIQVDSGVKLVAETGQSLDRILNQVNEINNAVTGIAAGAKEQATSLTEINAAITQMDQVTQKNAAMVEETTAASHSLSSEAAKLAGLVGQFKVGPSNADLRSELKAVAPHAFRSPSSQKTAAVRPSRQTASKKMVNAAPAPEAWDEF